MTIASFVAQNPPRCVSAFGLLPPSVIDDQTVAFNLRSQTGVSSAQLLGFDLATLNSEYDEEPLHVSPLSIMWSDSEERILLLDTHIHGYHGELGASAKIRGTGIPAPFKCPQCGGTTLENLQVEFHYWDETVEMWEGGELQGPAQDYFSVFTLRAACRNCGSSLEPTVLDL